MKPPPKLLPFAALIGVAILQSGCGAVPVAVVVGSYAADGALIATTDKSSSDHLMSMNSDKDCATWRALLKGGPVCRERTDGKTNPYNVDYTAPFRSGGDGGVEVVQSSRDGGKLLIGDRARDALVTHTPDLETRPQPTTTATAGVPGEARFGSAGQPAVAPTPEGADVATAGSRSGRRR